MKRIKFMEIGLLAIEVVYYAELLVERIIQIEGE
jgi:hypothetical protein